MIKLRLNKKWLEISQSRTLEEQNVFLHDSLRLQKSKPSNSILIYVAFLIYAAIFWYIGIPLMPQIMILCLLLHLGYVLLVFNEYLNKFKKRWYND